MISIAIGLILYNNNQSNKVLKENEEVIVIFDEVIKKNINNTEIKENTNTIISENITNTDTSININGYNYSGILSIPGINLTIPIIENWSYPNLKISSCIYSGSIRYNNLVIAGHNYKSTFRKLYDLHEGNTAYFKTSDGLIYNYKLEKIEILNPTEVDNMKNSSYDLTLFTCTIGGKNRYTLRFSRI